MASLPLFSPSFMPRDGAAFTPSRPAAHEHPVSPAARSIERTAPQAGPDATMGNRRPDALDPSMATTVLRTEAALREAGLAGRFWRGDALSTSPLPSVPSGFRALDEELPSGGWPSRCLTELLLSHVGVGEIRFLATTLASLTQAGREIVLLGPPHVPDPTGWEQLGIDMRRVLIVRTPQPADRLWALEQSLKSAAFGALVAWLPEERTLARNDALRRLQLAAASANGLTFLMRPAAAQFHASPAPLRLTLSTGPVEGSRRTLSVRLLKRRGPVLAKPITLLLPEIHRGMKAFNAAEAELDALTAHESGLVSPALRTARRTTSECVTKPRDGSPPRAGRPSATDAALPHLPALQRTLESVAASSAMASISEAGCAPSPSSPLFASDALVGALLSDARA